MSGTVLKSPAEIRIMDEANDIVRGILAELRRTIRPGMGASVFERRSATTWSAVSTRSGVTSVPVPRESFLPSAARTSMRAMDWRSVSLMSARRLLRVRGPMGQWLIRAPPGVLARRRVAPTG